MKRCNYCNREISSRSGPQCDKCIKNQAKYGTPTTCKYCKLPAAFVDQKCVHCAYSERKHGAPRECSHCKRRAAFKDNSRQGSLYCRPCAMKLGKETAGSKHTKKESSKTKHNKDKPSNLSQTKSFTSNALASIMPIIPKNGSSGTPTTSAMALIGVESPEEKIQQLREKNEDLQRQLVDTQKQLKEKQSRIVDLEAEQHRKDKEFREKNQQNQKLFDTTLQNLQDQIKQLNRELASKKR
ncbi:unnamed protein product [Bursaphelenchus okinawaensis]|uniref:Protein FAM76A n=1 Tax=Bursaphelenchus okinawaensis TaxID=465554 RepID=A0A811JVT2_9BILA|nr:unnamed protein product [Bursaphelenchus okinawaensis]CAG9086238.1 unnamed protein product [Bursaphelenchus okinawaensis]